MVRHFEYDGKTYRELVRMDEGAWVIDTCGLYAPKYISEELFKTWTPVTVKIEETLTTSAQKTAQEKRQALISLLIQDMGNVWDIEGRMSVARDIAASNDVSLRSILRYYYAYLAKGAQGLLPRKREQKQKERTDDQKNIIKALSMYYYSSRKMSLEMAYEMMLHDYYQTETGILTAQYPSFHQFRYIYQKTKDVKKKIIAREGLGAYRKDYRPLMGAGDSGIDSIGLYEMDATIADIHLVSRYDRKPIGRPYIYLAVDVASRLIAGLYVGLSGGKEAVLACLANAASDKVDYCRKYGIDITPDMWPSHGIPGKICTDRGPDFLSKHVAELCELFHMEITNLPAYRPDLKGFVEKAFDCIQKRYKPLLHGKGIIEKNAMGVGEATYIEQACLDISEFTGIVIQCVLYYNNHHVIKSIIRTPEMRADNVLPVAVELWKWYEKTEKANLTWVNEEDMRLMMLPRADAYITRYGLEYNKLTYTNERFEKEYVQAGISGRRKVSIAFDPLCDDMVFLISSGEYIPFELTLSCKQFRNLSMPEVNELLESERAVAKQAEGMHLQGRIDCTQRIVKIAEESTAIKFSKDDTRADKRNERQRNEKRHE